MSQGVQLPIVVKQDDNNTILAYCPIFKGCHTFSENKQDLSHNIEDVVGMYFDMYKSGDKDILDGDNVLYLNFDTNGKITSDFSQALAEDSLKVLS
ncbi:type II toxin-antitoxin system HicB family antitoxin [Candidatus Gracilibacteria bacterium]|nr:type II toxin-antitoxin system HicB family antitoxin [Candidatus Gracilibacteria bacterium]